MKWLKTYQITKRLLVTFANAWPEVEELPLGVVTVDACTATDNGASDAWLSCRPFFTFSAEMTTTVAENAPSLTACSLLNRGETVKEQKL